MTLPPRAMTALQDARSAYARRDWPRAQELFASARTAGELPADDLYALSDALWWLGDNIMCVSACERAYHLYLDEDRPRRAAIAALDIAVVHFLGGDDTAGSGWISRARRLLDSEPEAAEHGYILYIMEVEGPLGGITPSEPKAADSLIAAARRVQDIGRRHGDRTLVAGGTLGEGRALVKVGRVADGLALLDEAMVAVLSDELNPAWAGNIYCHLMSAAEELGDIRRAREWTTATTKWLASLPAAVVFNGICRVHRSRVHQLSGDWDLAEREAARVCEELADLDSGTAAAAHYQVGEIRRLRGDFAGSEGAYQRAHSLGHDPQPGLAMLRLAQGRVDAALASIRTATVAEPNRLSRARLLAAQVEIALAAGNMEEARSASDELDEIAAVYGSLGLQVAARHARGAVFLSAGSPEQALPILREACRGWSSVEAPYDCARVRVLLARAYRLLGDDDAANREIDVASAAFERLGAARDAQLTDAMRPARILPGGLTPREAEVLELVAAGRTNREVAVQLDLSEKTVARHLSNIFAKIGVSSRTAAASFAFEHGLAAARDR